MACMCGDTACRSCGPAQGSPQCEYSKYRCGLPDCPCATNGAYLEPDPEDFGFDEQDFE